MPTTGFVVGVTLKWAQEASKAFKGATYILDGALGLLSLYEIGNTMQGTINGNRACKAAYKTCMAWANYFYIQDPDDDAWVWE